MHRSPSIVLRHEGERERHRNAQAVRHFHARRGAMRIDLALAAVEVGADKVNRLEPFRRFHRFELLEGNIRLAGILLDNIARPLIEIIAGRDAVLIEQAVGVPSVPKKPPL